MINNHPIVWSVKLIENVDFSNLDLNDSEFIEYLDFELLFSLNHRYLIIDQDVIDISISKQ